MAWIGGIERLSTGKTPVVDGLELGELGDFPDPITRKVG